MSRCDLVILGGTVVLPGLGPLRLDIGVKNGRVAARADSLSAADGDRVVAARGRHVLPGAVDSHLHLGIYRPHAEDARSESASAVLAGAVLLATTNKDLLLPFLILFGASWGGLYTLLQLLTVESFGLRAAGKILGTITVLDAFGGGLGPWITGVLYQRTGSYQSAFVLIAVLVAIATVVAASIRVKPRRA